jgi:DNA-binding NarL/FixJ family response regulator
MSAKAIGRDLGISVRTVRNHVCDAAARLPGNGPPRFKLIVFILEDDPPT